MPRCVPRPGGDLSPRTFPELQETALPQLCLLARKCPRGQRVNVLLGDQGCDFLKLKVTPCAPPPTPLPRPVRGGFFPRATRGRLRPRRERVAGCESLR